MTMRTQNIILRDDRDDVRNDDDAHEIEVTLAVRAACAAFKRDVFLDSRYTNRCTHRKKICPASLDFAK